MILLLGADARARGVADGLRAAGLELRHDPGVDLGQMAAVRAAVVAARPDAVVVMGARLADPDTCRREPERAFRENAEDLIHVAAAALEVKARCVLVSTSAVFGGRGGPWMSSDEAAPEDPLAVSCLQGERFVERAARGRALVVRAGVLVGSELSAARARLAAGPVDAPEDETVSVLAAEDLGRLVAAALAAGRSGIVHASGPGLEPSWAELWQHQAERLGLADGQVRPVSGRGRPDRAACPRLPLLIADDLVRSLEPPVLDWRAAIDRAAAATPAVSVAAGTRPTPGLAEPPVSGAKGAEPRVWRWPAPGPVAVHGLDPGWSWSARAPNHGAVIVHVVTGKALVERAHADGQVEDHVLAAGQSVELSGGGELRVVAIDPGRLLSLGDVVWEARARGTEEDDG